MSKALDAARFSEVFTDADIFVSVFDIGGMSLSGLSLDGLVPSRLRAVVRKVSQCALSREDWDNGYIGTAYRDSLYGFTDLYLLPENFLRTNHVILFRTTESDLVGAQTRLIARIASGRPDLVWFGDRSITWDNGILVTVACYGPRDLQEFYG